MSYMVKDGAMLCCSFSVPPRPGKLKVLPLNRVRVEGRWAATIMDHVPMVNIPSFGMCLAPTNPLVIKNTALAGGIPTPDTCTPVTPAPWINGATSVQIGSMPALDSSAQCLCAWLGVITILNPEVRRTQIPALAPPPVPDSAKPPPPGQGKTPSPAPDKGKATGPGPGKAPAAGPAPTSQPAAEPPRADRSTPTAPPPQAGGPGKAGSGAAAEPPHADPPADGEEAS